MKNSYLLLGIVIALPLLLLGIFYFNSGSDDLVRTSSNSYSTGDYSDLGLKNSDQKVKELIESSYISGKHYMDFNNKGLTEFPDICRLANPDILTGITDIDISNNLLTEVNVDLSCLPNLREFLAYDNKIISIPKFVVTTQLKVLRLHRNQLSSISGLSLLSGLMELNLGYNNLSDVSDLTKLSNLQILELQHNNINNVDGFDKLLNLQILKLEFNKLKNVGSLRKLKNLVHLTLGYNQLDEKVVKELSKNLSDN